MGIFFTISWEWQVWSTVSTSPSWTDKQNSPTTEQTDSKRASPQSHISRSYNENHDQKDFKTRSVKLRATLAQSPESFLGGIGGRGAEAHRPSSGVADRSTTAILLDEPLAPLRSLSPALHRVVRCLSPPQHCKNQSKCLERSRSLSPGDRSQPIGHYATRGEEETPVPQRVMRRIASETRWPGAIEEVPYAARMEEEPPVPQRVMRRTASETRWPRAIEGVRAGHGPRMVFARPAHDVECRLGSSVVADAGHTCAHSVAASGEVSINKSPAWNPSIREKCHSPSIRDWSTEEFASVLLTTDNPDAAAAIAANKICGKSFLQMRESGLPLSLSRGQASFYLCVVSFPESLTSMNLVMCPEIETALAGCKYDASVQLRRFSESFDMLHLEEFLE
jgi:hypothetical protein